MVGIEYGLNLAAAFEWNYGFKADYTKGAMLEDSERDILFKAKEDFIIGAGDEFCLAAGTKEPDANNLNKSVIRATPDGVTLGLGPSLTETGEGIGAGTWYQTQEPESSAKWFAFALSVVGLLVTGLSEIGTATTPDPASGPNETKEVPKPWSYGTFTTLGIVANLGALLAAKNFYSTHASDEKIEPVRHKAPPQKVWMHRSGTIGIISTKGEDVQNKEEQVSGKHGIIVIGVNKQKESKVDLKKWQFYDSYVHFDDRTKADAKARAKEGKTRLKTYLQGKATKVYLDEGSNIVIEKDKIWLRSGEPGKESSEILLDNKTNKKARIARKLNS